MWFNNIMKAKHSGKRFSTIVATVSLKPTLKPVFDGTDTSLYCICFLFGRRITCEQALLLSRARAARVAEESPFPPTTPAFASLFARLSRVYFSRYPTNEELACRLERELEFGRNFSNNLRSNCYHRACFL